MGTEPVTVVIATPLDEQLVARIETSEDQVEVLYQPDLLPPVRYPGDHKGKPSFSRDDGAERRWAEMLGSAEVLFGLPGDSASGLAWAVRTNPKLRWVQATAAGAGEQVRGAELTREELDRVVITSASGVHAVPLAEFCLLGLLAFTRGLPRILADQAARKWDHYPVLELVDTTVMILGLGGIGTEVARLAKAFGMRTLGVNRRGETDSAHVDQVFPTGSIQELIPQADSVVITLPLTQETEGLIGAEAISAMRPGSVLVNVGRGGVVDEASLVEALAGGTIAGAALDVFEHEPLPPDSPLWSLPNVIISPHTAALSWHENERIVDLFVDNIHRYLDGSPLRSRVDPNLFY